jgi:hypothetical protein
MQGQKKDEKESLKPNRIKLSSNFLRLHCALTECNSDLLWLISLPEFTRSSDTFGCPRHSCGGGKTN